MTLGHLKDHTRRHKNERPFVCSYCGTRFLRGCALKIHIRRHTGERPYNCQYPGCGKTFTEKGNLNSHIKTHGDFQTKSISESKEIQDRTIKEIENNITELLSINNLPVNTFTEEEKNLPLIQQDAISYTIEGQNLDDILIGNPDLYCLSLNSICASCPSSPCCYDLKPTYSSGIRMFVPYKPPINFTDSILDDDLNNPQLEKQINIKGVVHDMISRKNVMPCFTIAAYLCTDPSS